ncbi:MAG: protein-disulfide reductase DsbD family protein [Sphingomonadaceae bacterium]
MPAGFRLISLFRLLLACMAFAFTAAPLAAKNNIAAELLLMEDSNGGQQQTYAIHFTPDPGWHGYWSNPGDAGYGMELEWSWPQDWFGEPQYPVPHRLLLQGLMNHVYKEDYAVLVPATLPAEAALDDLGPVTVKARWLACTDKICVPEEAVLTARPALGDKRLDQWRAAIPPMLDQRARYAIADGKLRLGIPFPATGKLADPHIFIRTPDLVQYAMHQRISRKGDMLVAEIPLMEFSDPDALDEVSGILAMEDGQGVRFVAERGDVPANGPEIITNSAEGATPPLWTLLLGALAGGLLLNIMPCVFPILSLKALSLARAGESEAEARREGIAYTAGAVLACTALGALLLVLRAGGEQIGWAFQLQEPGVVVALLVLAVLITANFAGVFSLPSLSFTRDGEPASAFTTGLLAAFVATPCTGPFMAAALGAALLLPPVPALLLFATLGLGLALPFLLIGFLPSLRRRLPKPGPWMETFRRAMAIPMGLTALALIWLLSRMGGKGFALMVLVVIAGLVIALVVVGRLQQRGKLAWPAFALIAAPFLIFGAFALPASLEQPNASGAPESILPAQPFSAEALAETRASGKPVFLWFTADWCLTCKVNEGVAIEREATKQAFEKAGVIPMVGDWTRRDEDIARFLDEQGAAGVPLYLWYEPGKEGEQLPQVLTPDMLTELAGRERPRTDIGQ